MLIKKGVCLLGLQPQMRKVLIKADEIWTDFGEELVITSAVDGLHSAGSLHYYGLALDFRIRYFNPEDRERIAVLLSVELGSDYDVVLESTHIHVEYANGGF